MALIPIILSGGSGTRLWPMSRANMPKQFCKFWDESLLTKSILRLNKLGEPWCVTTKSLQPLTEKSFKETGIKTSNIIYEPFGKNTAPAIALLCKSFELSGKSQETVGVFPSDHFIEKTDLFLKCINEAANAAQSGSVVTLGIVPTNPSTGYGYIEVNSKIDQIETNKAVVDVVRFREKPDQNTAEEFIQSRKFLWNAGIFVFKVSDMVSAFQTYMPKLWSSLSTLKKDFSNLEEVYSTLESQSIDFGIMEKLKNQKCVPCDIGWSDVGSWDEITKYIPEHNDKIEIESKNCTVITNQTKNYSFLNCEDLILVDTRDAMLVFPKGKSDKISDLLKVLKSDKPQMMTDFFSETRNWGEFEVLRDGNNFKSKIIKVDPGQRLSYQSHVKRAEHWILIKGVAEVTLDDQIYNLKSGEHIFIPKGAKHRISNKTDELVEFIEIQVGEYFGEDDIHRYSDDYGRA
ncbi:MAG: mannose-1-phosphate guanylyltransferase/mannose-6-phosphate isomerase [Bdellovibrionota bacterium]